jgi:hypothetical protein
VSLAMRPACKHVGVLLLSVVATACAAPSDEEEIGESHDEIRSPGSFVARGSGYFPADDPVEGGFVDRRGKRLRTLQQFLAGTADYVSVAMDTNAFEYGQRLAIRELEEKYGRAIVFRVVDTGGAFRGKGRSRIDICTANRAASLDRTINGTLHIDVVDDRSGPSDPVEAPRQTEPPPTEGGAACSSHGACNPGNDGSGLICVGGRCVPGCVSNIQCPGTSTCQPVGDGSARQCR